jgi:hypothetical protein
MQGEGGNGKERGRTPTACVTVARKPPDQWDLLAATSQLVTEVTILNREETIYELMESTGSMVWPGNRHHLGSAAERVWQ